MHYGQKEIPEKEYSARGSKTIVSRFSGKADLHDRPSLIAGNSANLNPALYFPREGTGAGNSRTKSAH